MSQGGGGRNRGAAIDLQGTAAAKEIKEKDSTGAVSGAAAVDSNGSKIEGPAGNSVEVKDDLFPEEVFVV